MRAIEVSDRARTGIIGILLGVLLLGVGQSLSSIPMLFTQATYYGQFTDSAGLNPGDKVRIDGVDVGTVTSTALRDGLVVVGFNLGGHTIGTDSRLAIRTNTILGMKVLEIDPHGSEELKPHQVLPVGQSTEPYQIYDAFFDVSTAASGWDIDTVKQSLTVLADTVDQATPHLGAALRGVADLSDVIGQRDEQFTELLAGANDLAAVFGERSADVNRLLIHARELLAAVNERGAAISQLLERVSAVSEQVAGLIEDNPNLGHVLRQLQSVTDLLADRKDDLAELLSIVRNYSAGLSEALGSGPYFKALVANLVPGQIMQPFVDAAFKERGIDPENFWRDAGLPVFQWPDPNGAPQPNRAPPPAPPVREGTPEHPGPAVVPGAPCSYTPPPDGLPRPDNPLPCAAVDQGPFGPVPGGFGPPAVLTAPTKTEG